MKLIRHIILRHELYKEHDSCRQQDRSHCSLYHSSNFDPYALR